MRLAILLAAVFSLSTPAFAAGGGEPAPARTDGDPSVVELPMLVAPVTVQDRLYHYAYMRVVLKASGADVAVAAQEKIAFILDAMLREVHRNSIALDGDPDAIDGNGLKKRLLAAANSVMGEGKFVSLSFRDTIQTDDPVANQKLAEEAEFNALLTPKVDDKPKTASAH